METTVKEVSQDQNATKVAVESTIESKATRLPGIVELSELQLFLVGGGTGVGSLY